MSIKSEKLFTGSGINCFSYSTCESIENEQEVLSILYSDLIHLHVSFLIFQINRLYFNIIAIFYIVKLNCCNSIVIFAFKIFFILL